MLQALQQAAAELDQDDAVETAETATEDFLADVEREAGDLAASLVADETENADTLEAETAAPEDADEKVEASPVDEPTADEKVEAPPAKPEDTFFDELYEKKKRKFDAKLQLGDLEAEDIDQIVKLFNSANQEQLITLFTQAKEGSSGNHNLLPDLDPTAVADAIIAMRAQEPIGNLFDLTAVRGVAIGAVNRTLAVLRLRKNLFENVAETEAPPVEEDEPAANETEAPQADVEEPAADETEDETAVDDDEEPAAETPEDEDETVVDDDEEETTEAENETETTHEMSWATFEALTEQDKYSELMENHDNRGKCQQKVEGLIAKLEAGEITPEDLQKSLGMELTYNNYFTSESQFDYFPANKELFAQFVSELTGKEVAPHGKTKAEKNTFGVLKRLKQWWQNRGESAEAQTDTAEDDAEDEEETADSEPSTLDDAKIWKAIYGSAKQLKYKSLINVRKFKKQQTKILSLYKQKDTPTYGSFEKDLTALLFGNDVIKRRSIGDNTIEKVSEFIKDFEKELAKASTEVPPADTDTVQPETEATLPKYKLGAEFIAKVKEMGSSEEISVDNLAVVIDKLAQLFEDSKTNQFDKKSILDQKVKLASVINMYVLKMANKGVLLPVVNEDNVKNDVTDIIDFAKREKKKYFDIYMDKKVLTDDEKTELRDVIAGLLKSAHVFISQTDAPEADDISKLQKSLSSTIGLAVGLGVKLA